jgi:hypothetical protein
MCRFRKTIMKALGLRWRRQEETGCSGLNPVHDANCGMEAMAPETMPQESMVRAIQIRAPTRRGGGKAQRAVIAGQPGERVNSTLLPPRSLVTDRSRGAGKVLLSPRSR